MEKVTNTLKNYIVDAVLLIALGLVMLIWPQWSLKIIFTWIGIGLIVTGAVTAECQLMSLLMTFACQLSSSTETLEKEGYAQ